MVPNPFSFVFLYSFFFRQHKFGLAQQTLRWLQEDVQLRFVELRVYNLNEFVRSNLYELLWHKSLQLAITHTCQQAMHNRTRHKTVPRTDSWCLYDSVGSRALTRTTSCFSRLPPRSRLHSAPIKSWSARVASGKWTRPPHRV